MVGSVVVSTHYSCWILFFFVSKKNCTGESDVTTASIAASAAPAVVMVKQLPSSPPNLHVLWDEY